MPLLARTVHTPLAIHIRRGAVADLDRLLADERISTGGEVAVVGSRAWRGGRRANSAPTRRGGPVPGLRWHPRRRSGAGEKLRLRSYDAVVGIGGGKTIDTAKWAAARYGIPMVSVATSLSHDGIASPVASLDHDGGRGSTGSICRSR